MVLLLLVLILVRFLWLVVLWVIDLLFGFKGFLMAIEFKLVATTFIKKFTTGWGFWWVLQVPRIVLEGDILFVEKHFNDAVGFLWFTDLNQLVCLKELFLDKLRVVLQMDFELGGGNFLFLNCVRCLSCRACLVIVHHTGRVYVHWTEVTVSSFLLLFWCQVWFVILHIAFIRIFCWLAILWILDWSWSICFEHLAWTFIFFLFWACIWWTIGRWISKFTFMVSVGAVGAEFALAVLKEELAHLCLNHRLLRCGKDTR